MRKCSCLDVPVNAQEKFLHAIAERLDLVIELLQVEKSNQTVVEEKVEAPSVPQHSFDAEKASTKRKRKTVPKG